MSKKRSPFLLCSFLLLALESRQQECQQELRAGREGDLKDLRK